VDIQKIADLYDDRVRNLGISPNSVGWKSTQQQKLRFEQLIQGLDLKGSSVLDLGSGFGDLASYLETQNIHLSQYLGIEISKEMLSAARNQFKGHSAVSFEQADFLVMNTDRWDFVLASGSLNYRVADDMYGYLEDVISKYSGICQRGLLINLLTDQVDFMQLQHAHYNPQKVNELMQQYFRKVTLIENYGLYEFTIQGLK
jgi:SAM-dependent methyltransferase